MKKGFLDQRWPWLVAAGVLILAFLSSFVEIHLGGEPDPRPLGSADQIAAFRQRTDTNVLFILVDTLRADHLGVYGYHRDTSPVLDALAGNGVRFARQLSQSSWTKASMASLWTSLYPARTGITRFDQVIPDAARMPAEILKDAGFTTAGIWRNGWVAPTFGFQQGFDVYLRPVPGPLPAEVRIHNPTIKTGGSDEDAISSAVEFLRLRNGKQRWFLYVHLMDVHEYLYDDKSALFGGSYADIYDNSIRRVDGLIGVLLDYLTDMGFADNTLVAISSDHGEAFRERGYEGHAREVYKETTEVPFLIRLPFRLEPGIVVPSRTRNVDVWPTLLDLVGLSMPSDIDGRSLVPDILAAAQGTPGPDVDRTAIAHLDQSWGQRTQPPRPTVAVVQGPLRYVRMQNENGSQRLEQLFDADRDPAELHDRAAEDPDALARLRGRADEYMALRPPWGEAPKREMDELELNQLRALGYAIP